MDTSDWLLALFFALLPFIVLALFLLAQAAIDRRRDRKLDAIRARERAIMAPFAGC